MLHKSLNSFLALKRYCENEHFKGWDPYDGLDSKIFQSIPLLRQFSLPRLLIIQAFKRLPVSLRPLFLVPRKYNAKALALFLQGYCNLYTCVEADPQIALTLGTKGELRRRIDELAALLIEHQSEGYHGACWGYGFDWQSKAFFLPRHTPTVVVTSFAVEGLLSAYEITKCEAYLTKALSAADFILLDLNRMPKKGGYMFSYSPLDRRAVYNASLLGSKTLSLIYHYTQDITLKKAAYASVRSVCDRQNTDGSFPHSDQIGNKWRDNFHTGFKLESLSYYQKYCKDASFSRHLKSGYVYWLENFFIPGKGMAKYYDTDNENGVIDLHCIAQAIPTFYKMEELGNQVRLVDKLLESAINDMQHKEEGYFYFQKKGKRINRIPYMRWPNAWMFYGMSYWILFNTMHGKY